MNPQASKSHWQAVAQLMQLHAEAELAKSFQRVPQHLKPAQLRSFPASSPQDVYKMLSGFACKAFLVACTLLKHFAVSGLLRVAPKNEPECSDSECKKQLSTACKRCL